MGVLIMNNSLIWIQEWFKKHCDGDWEHQNGIRIETIDNPGWKIVIDLVDSELEGKIFVEIKVDRTELNWMHCRVEGSQLIGFCGTYNLTEVMDIFRLWAETPRE
jgi:hypothetical protein